MTSKHRLDAIAAILPLCAFSAMDSATAPAQEQVIATFHLSLAEYGWVTAAQYLAIAISAPLIGRCGDVFDKKDVMAISLSIACLGGLLSMYASSLVIYMIAQVLLCAWVGAGTVAVAFISDVSSPGHEAGGQGYIQGLTGLFAAAGLLCAGPVLSKLGTVSLFWLPAAASLPCTVLLARHVLLQQQSKRNERLSAIRQVDAPGGLVMGALLALLTFALLFVNSGGWMTVASCVCLVVICLILPKWLRSQKTHTSPFMDIAILARRDVACIHVIALVLGVGTSAMYFLLPMLVSASSATGANFGSNALAVGGLLLPLGITGVVLMPAYSRLDQHLGPRKVLALALTCIATSLVIPVIWRREIWPLLACTTLFGIGLSLTFTEGITELLRRVPHERAAGASSTFTLAKTLGSMLGAVVFSLVLGANGEAGSTASLLNLSIAFSLAAATCAIGMLAVVGIAPRLVPAARAVVD